MKKKTTALLIGAVAVLLAAVFLCAWLLRPQPVGITVYDAKGELLVQGESREAVCTSDYWAYIDIAVTEAVNILSQRENISYEKAEKQLFLKGYSIYTELDRDMYEKLKTALSEYPLEIGCAITDLKGGLLAVYSTEGSNRANAATAPYSAFKPLSVYTPALEAGMIHWASQYEDAPYKQMKDSDGTERGWPANASGIYSYKQADISEAIRQSLNTVAVRCLIEYGVKQSMDFLEQKLGVPMAAERYVAEHYGEEELLGSIALGYLEKGVSPVDMAGYYQIFATGGNYTKPVTIARLLDSQGKLIHKRQKLERQVISAATADLMNKLLQGVVTDGTGRQAACEDVPVAGKTGTGDDYAGNWFVGVTPGYSCAVWHGTNDTNQAAEMFAGVIRNVYKDQPDANRVFITHANLFPTIYCTDSGKAICQGCSSIAMGYFPKQTPLPVCDKH